jgi:hypothetical protein
MSLVCWTLGKGIRVKQARDAATPTATSRKDAEMIFLLVVAAVVVAAPLAAAVLVTVASLREDSARSLAGRPPGWLTAIARRLLCLRTAPDRQDRPPLPPPPDGVALSPDDGQIPPPRSDWADESLTVPRS